METAAYIKCPSCNELVRPEYVICPYCGADITQEIKKHLGVKLTWSDVPRRIQNILYKDPIKGMLEVAISPDNRVPLLVLLALGFFNGLRLYFIFLNVYPVPDFLKGLFGFFVLEIISTIVFFIVLFLLWRFSGFVISFFVASLGSKLPRKQARSLFGYSLIPIVIGTILTAFLFIGSQGINALDPNTSISDWAEFFTSPLFFIAQILMLIFWLWSLGLLTIGVSKASKITYFESFIATGLVYFIWISLVFSFIVGLT